MFFYQGFLFQYAKLSYANDRIDLTSTSATPQGVDDARAQSVLEVS